MSSPPHTGSLRCAIHQPNWFPRPATLTKIASADIWIILDDVQFTRRDYQHRTRIADPANPDTSRWLTLPVHLPDGRATRIRDVRIAAPAATRTRTYWILYDHYRRYPGWAAIQSTLPPVLDAITDGNLAAAAETSTRALLHLLGWHGAIYHSSDFTVRHGRSERLADLTAQIGATTYICGQGGARYLQTEPFAQHRIAIEHHQPSPTKHATLSALHALSCCGSGG